MPKLYPEKLEKKHLADLSERGLSTRTIRDNSFESVPDGILIPYRELTGEINCASRIRLIPPWDDKRGEGKKQKYRQPRGSAVRAYFPKGAIEAINTPRATLCITEGEFKSVKATQEGFPCIGLGGIWNWKVGKKDSNTDKLIPDLAAIDWEERTVYIVFDWDPKLGTRLTVLDAAKRLKSLLEKAGATVHIVKLPPGPNRTKNAVDDLLVRVGPDTLKELLDDHKKGVVSGKVSGSDTTPGKKPLKNKGETVSGKRCRVGGKKNTFPVDVFPQVIEKYCVSLATAIGCPIDFVGSMALAVVSACIGRKRAIQIKRGWKEYPLLWIAVIAASGERKSPAFDAVTEPLRKRQQKLLAEYLEAKDKYNKSEDKDDPPPRLKQVYTTDTTIEALKDVLASNPEGIAFLADELAGWIRAMSQYKGGRGDDRAIWLSIWSGTSFACNRKGAEPVFVNDPFVAITGGVQPSVLGDFIDGREDGLAARVLFSFPGPSPPAGWSDDEVKASDLWNGVCESLLDLDTTSKPITFSADAKALWVEWVEKHRQEIVEVSESLKPTWSKSEGHTLRFALILYLLRVATNATRDKQIDVESISGAIRLMDYYKSHAEKVYAKASEVTDKGKLARTIQWIKKQGGTVTARLAYRNSFCRDLDDATELFADLQAEGYGTYTTRGKDKNLSHIFTLAPESDP